jgi:ABC-type molybdate transport system permease subunit
MLTFVLSDLLLCVIAGYLGKDSRLGFWGVFYVSLILSPILGFLLVILFGRRDSTIRVENVPPGRGKS